MPSTVRLDADQPGDLERAAAILRRGGLVAFPTETVYGLGANALDIAAVHSIFAAKGRPAWDPLIVHLGSSARLASVTEIGTGLLAERVALLTDAFWPGPLTLLLPRSAEIADEITAGRRLVGVRVPAHPVALRLLEAADLPVAAPSANRFGHISPTTAQHVLDDLEGRIDAVLDGGATGVGVESTVLDPSETPMVIYRAGAVTVEMLEQVTGLRTELFVPPQQIESAGSALVSPGMSMRHYAPEARLILSGPTLASLKEALERAQNRSEGRTGVLLPIDWRLGPSPGLTVQPWGTWGDAASLAAALFAGLRSLEEGGMTTIVCPLPPPGGLGDALRDRLLKAARPR